MQEELYHHIVNLGVKLKVAILDLSNTKDIEFAKPREILIESGRIITLLGVYNNVLTYSFLENIVHANINGLDPYEDFDIIYYLYKETLENKNNVGKKFNNVTGYRKSDI